jgi:uncharacterized protein (DUF2132 family)
MEKQFQRSLHGLTQVYTKRLVAHYGFDTLGELIKLNVLIIPV